MKLEGKDSRPCSPQGKKEPMMMMMMMIIIIIMMTMVMVMTMMLIIRIMKVMRFPYSAGVHKARFDLS